MRPAIRFVNYKTTTCSAQALGHAQYLLYYRPHERVPARTITWHEDEVIEIVEVGGSRFSAPPPGAQAGSLADMPGHFRG